MEVNGSCAFPENLGDPPRHTAREISSPRLRRSRGMQIFLAQDRIFSREIDSEKAEYFRINLEIVSIRFQEFDKTHSVCGDHKRVFRDANCRKVWMPIQGVRDMQEMVVQD